MTQLHRLPDHEDRRQALLNFQQNLVVTAGAGTGKTSLLVGRLLSALVLRRLEPSQVLAVTFTENAASEMNERLLRLLRTVEPWLSGEAGAAGASGASEESEESEKEEKGDIDASDRYILEQLPLGPKNLRRVRELLQQVEPFQISTFHGYCMRLLQENARQLDLPPDLQIETGENQRDGFDEAFLAFLHEQTRDGSSPALERFEAGELMQLARSLLDLPDESLSGITPLPLPANLEEGLDRLRRTLHLHPKTSENWRRNAAELEHCYEELLAGQQPDAGEVFSRGDPYKGGRGVGKDKSDELQMVLRGHRDTLRPYALADEDGVAQALDFLAPFVVQYRRLATASGRLSFQDLLLLVRRHLMHDEHFRERIAGRLKAIMVDEFQDTDPLQYDVVFMLAAKPVSGSVEEPMQLEFRPGTLFIVGDAKQSIYRFRRADVVAFTRVVDRIHAQSGVRLNLRANFRSQKPILDFANQVCQETLTAEPPYQFGYEAVEPMLPGDDPKPVQLIEVGAGRELSSAARREAEGRAIVGSIQGLHQDGLAYSEMAILLRAATETSWILRPLRKAQIPFVLEGSKRFYQKQEILLATALIRAMAFPHDEVAVLAILRSALSAATDAEILAFTDKDAKQRLDFRLPRQGSGAVHSCLDMLAEVHGDISPLSIDQALTRILELDALLLSEAAGYEGAQRLANLERLLDQLLMQGPLDLAEAAALLSENTITQTDDEESPLFELDLNAVRILTVHKAKGLEFEAVLLPDLARQDQARRASGSTGARSFLDNRGRQVLDVRIGGSQNRIGVATKGERERHERAEQRRLFYVASTRAKKHLILISGENRRSCLWKDDLGEVKDLLVQRCRETDLLPAQETAGRVQDHQPTLKAFQEHERQRQEFSTRLRPGDLAPSRHVVHDLAHVSAHVSAPVSGDREATGNAMLIGTVMHHYLALVDLCREGVDRELLDALPQAAGIAGDIDEMARRYHASPLRQRLSRARALHREVPLSHATPEGFVNAAIDLLIEWEDGRLAILDWKTDRISKGQHQAAAQTYRPQLEAYALGVREALCLEADPELLLHFLRDDMTVTLGAAAAE